jgi:hypothetical protein
MMSGDASLRKPRTLQWHNEMYKENVKLCGLELCSNHESAISFRDTEAKTLIDRLPPSQHWCAAIDGQFLKRNIDLGDLADSESYIGKPKWCKEILIGDCLHDVS